jgi:hypothetical protein
MLTVSTLAIVIADTVGTGVVHMVGIRLGSINVCWAIAVQISRLF